jgi:2-oxoisovalerate dehydrogenase E2 component (dihydrolipoyl transacylase)
VTDDERIKPFLVPDLGEGLEEVTVSCWNVAVGDDVELNQPLCSVETAKAEIEIPSPYAGRIVEIRGAEGDVLEVGSLLVRIDTAPEQADAPPRKEAVPGDPRRNPPCASWQPNCSSICARCRPVRMA